MSRCLTVGFFLIIALMAIGASAKAASMTFDQAQWQTGDMNEQAPADSNGTIGSSNVDYFYYYERVPMRMAVLDDSLAAGSAQRTYDSAILAIVVAQSGATGNDSMRIFARRLSRDWSENGVSWNYNRALPDSQWTTPGGDIAAGACSDTIIIDANTPVYSTLRFHLDTGFVRSMIESINYGWLLSATNLVDRFPFQIYTEDCTTPAYRPILTVYYTSGSQAAAGARRRIILGGRQ